MKKAKCYNCGKTLTYTLNEPAGPSEFILDEKDFDGMAIFLCGSFKGCRFKLDMADYLKNKDKENFVAKTLDADLDFSDGFDKKPKKIKRSLFRKAKNFLGM